MQLPQPTSGDSTTCESGSGTLTPSSASWHRPDHGHYCSGDHLVESELACAAVLVAHRRGRGQQGLRCGGSLEAGAEVEAVRGAAFL